MHIHYKKIFNVDLINTTRIFINPDIPEAEAFKNQLVYLTLILQLNWFFLLDNLLIYFVFVLMIELLSIESDSTVPLIGERAKPSPQEEFLHMLSEKRCS
jgi:hypothetical protein